MTQPLLNLLGTAPDYFITYRLSPGDVRVFVAVLALLVPVSIWVLELLLSRAPRVRRSVHYAAVGGSLTVLVAQVIKVTVGINGITYVALTLVLGTLVVAAYRWWSSMRDWLAFIAIVPILAMALFFFSSPAGRYARAGAGASLQQSVTDAPIIFLMLDEFPSLSLLNGKGEIDAVRYPNFARLAARTNWYRNYSTTAEVTHFAIPAALSGVYPKRGLGSTYVDHPDTLFSLVAENHEMNVWESITKLCPPTVCKKSPISSESQSADWRGLFRGLRQVVRQRLDTTKTNEMNVFAVEGAKVPTTPISVATTTATTPSQPGTTASSPATTVPSKLPNVAMQTFIAAQQTQVFSQWVDSLTDSAKPQMSYLHVLLPHQPWIFLPNGMTYSTDEPESQPGETAWEARIKQQRHELQVQYLDTLIGRLIDRLEETNLFDKSLIVLAADHGVSFTEGYGRRFVTGDFANYPSIMHVPLFIHFPGQRVGEVIDDNVENVDVLPIIAKQMNFTIPWKVDGVVPEDKDATRRSTKSLLFVTDPYGSPKRNVPSMTVDFDVFAKQTMTSGYTLADPANNLLESLYAGTQHADLRFREVSTLTVRSGPLTFRIDSDVALQNPHVLVRGVISGNVAASDTFVFARDGVILGTSPVISRDGETRVATLLEPPKSSKKTVLTLYRVVDSSTLESVALSK